MINSIVFSTLLVTASAVGTAVTSGVAAQAKADLESIRTDVMAKGSQLFKLNAIKAGVKHLKAPKASSLLQGKSASQVRFEDLEAWMDSGAAVNSTLEPNSLHDQVKEMNDHHFKWTLQELEMVTDGSRYIGHSGNQKAAKYIMDTCTHAGLQTKEHKFDYAMRGLNLKQGFMSKMFQQNGNVACFKKGTDPQLSKETIVIGAHYDSVNWRENLPTGMEKAPGADDNGSGTTAILMIAKALEKLDSKRSILLVGFNAEEEGLLGSAAFVPEVVKSKEYGKIKAALIADEIAFPGRPEKHFTRRAIFETHKKTKGVEELVDTMAHNIADEQGEIAGFEVNKNGFGSDHMSFIDAGIPALLLIERDDEWHSDMKGHSSDDTTDDLSMDFGATMTRLLFRTGMALANPK